MSLKPDTRPNEQPLFSQSWELGHDLQRPTEERAYRERKDGGPSEVDQHRREKKRRSNEGDIEKSGCANAGAAKRLLA